MRVINLFAGPGTGKSTTSAALFAELKYQGYNTEYIPEYAKDATWEGRGPKVFAAQEYLFGKQHFRLARVADQVDFLVTDSPILQCIAYWDDQYLPSLAKVIREAHNRYDNINIFLERSDTKAYNPKGRNQSEDEARNKDARIRQILDDELLVYRTLKFSRSNVWEIIDLMYTRGWVSDPEKMMNGARDAALSNVTGIDLAIARRQSAKVA